MFISEYRQRLENKILSSSKHLFLLWNTLVCFGQQWKRWKGRKRRVDFIAVTTVFWYSEWKLQIWSLFLQMHVAVYGGVLGFTDSARWPVNSQLSFSFRSEAAWDLLGLFCEAKKSISNSASFKTLIIAMKSTAMPRAPHANQANNMRNSSPIMFCSNSHNYVKPECGCGCTSGRLSYWTQCRVHGRHSHLEAHLDLFLWSRSLLFFPTKP